MVEEDSDSDDEFTISVEYTPMELVVCLQLLDYLDLRFFEEGVPMGAVGLHRRKIMEALMKEDVHEEMEMERERRREGFEEMLGGRDNSNNERMGGFQ